MYILNCIVKVLPWVFSMGVVRTISAILQFRPVFAAYNNSYEIAKFHVPFCLLT